MCLWRFNEFWSKIRQKPQTHRCGAHQSTSVAKCRAFTPPTLIYTTHLYIDIYMHIHVWNGVSRGKRATFNESTGSSFYFLLLQFREFCWSKRGHSLSEFPIFFLRLFVANYNLFASNLFTRKCTSTRWFHCSFFIRPWWSMKESSIHRLCNFSFLFVQQSNKRNEPIQLLFVTCDVCASCVSNLRIVYFIDAIDDSSSGGSMPIFWLYFCLNAKKYIYMAL